MPTEDGKVGIGPHGVGGEWDNPHESRKRQSLWSIMGSERNGTNTGLVT